ncbi:MAG TPA: hypothetical protein VMT18_08565, partial [Planctomycetota bacterium]|nr:hypothetical protein [Planctomycetota bacterium]
MGLRQEQVVLIATAALLGLLAWSGADDGPRVGRARAGRAPQFQSWPAPDASRSLPAERAPRDGSRELFA